VKNHEISAVADTVHKQLIDILTQWCQVWRCPMGKRWQASVGSMKITENPYANAAVKTTQEPGIRMSHKNRKFNDLRRKNKIIHDSR